MVIGGAGIVASQGIQRGTESGILSVEILILIDLIMFFGLIYIIILMIKDKLKGE